VIEIYQIAYIFIRYRHLSFDAM